VKNSYLKDFLNNLKPVLVFLFGLVVPFFVVILSAIATILSASTGHILWSFAAALVGVVAFTVAKTTMDRAIA
jgi:hypothetical protein